MLNKIDKRLHDKISISSSLHKDIDIIVYLENYDRDIAAFESKYKDIKKFPFISCFGATLKLGEISKLASNYLVRFITDDCRVCSLMYKSKQFLNIDYLYSLVTQNYNYSIVVIDTGIYEHIDFVLGKNKLIKFIDLINNKTYPYDDNGHGTFITGIFCGNGINGKYAGIDKISNIIVIKALDNVGETSSIKILEAMQWVLENKEKYNISTVCMSFGSVYKEDDPLVDAAEILWNNGIVVVTAAGNSGPEKESIMSPGSSRRVVTVGSLNDISGGNISVAEFSSRGPSGRYYKPDIVVPGTDIISTNVFSNDRKFYTQMSGTSVSAPMVAGVASLLKNINPRYTPDEIKYMLISACTRIDGDRNKEGFGYLDLAKLVLL